MRAIALCLLALATTGAQAQDLRANYDVQTYRLDLQVNPTTKTLKGTVGIEAKALKPTDTLVLDLMAGRTVSAVTAFAAPLTPASAMTGKALAFTHTGDLITIKLGRTHAAGTDIRVAVTYAFTPSGGRAGITFDQTPDGKPWVTTSCQSLGAHSWWPQKGENEHPEDKFAHLYMNVQVPKGLTAVCAGKLTGRTVQGAWETFRWRHDYPCSNYAVSLNVAPYVELKGTLDIKGLAKPLPYSYYMLPQDVEKARLQFQDVPKMLEIYGEAFGPFPYPNSKFGLVQTPFWGMEHSTAVAYGNSFPAWIKVHGGEDKWAARNKDFDYILIHEVAHEWWGNAVSAKDWGHLWLHEGFGTYAEAVYMEKMYDRERADAYLATLRPKIAEQFTEYRGPGVLPSAAFSNNVYYKGAWILNTLRTFVNNDTQWWKSLREFNMRFRYKNATTEDFQNVLDEVTGKPWKTFFEQWFYTDAYPALRGTVSLTGETITVSIENPRVREVGFDIPLDVAWTEGGERRTRRILLSPGSNQLEIPCRPGAGNLNLPTLHRILGDNQVTVH